MNRYDRYKDSGIPWLGEVPEHWNIVGISKLFMLKAGGDLQPDFFSREKDDEHCYPIYTNANDEHAVYGYTSKKRFNADSITVSGRGDIGFAVYRDHDFDAIIRLLVLSPLKKLDCKYYTYSINALLNFKFESSAVAQLSTVQLAQYKLLLPDYEEQTAIAHYLDTKLGEIDALIGKQQTLIEKLAEQRTAVITHAVTKGLNPAAPMKNSGVEWLGEVPAHWSIIQFRRVVENIKDGTHGTHSRENNGFPLLSAKNVFNDGIHIHDNESQISEEDYKLITSNGFPKKNDLLITCVGSIGRCCIYPFDTPFAFQRSVAFLRLNKNAVPQFYKYFVESTCYQEQLKANVKLSIQGGVYLGTLISMYAILPTKEEQTSIVGYLNQETAKIDRLCDTVNQTIGRLKEYRTALITQAVTGKIKVTDE